MRRFVLMAAATAALLSVASAAGAIALPQPQCPPTGFTCPAPGGGG